MKITLIGSGNVATHLGSALKAAGHDIVQVYSRSASSAIELAKKLKSKPVTDIKKISGETEIYIASISDNALNEFLKAFPIKNKPVYHTSGSVSMAVFGKKYKFHGVLYPVQTFSKDRKIKFSEVPLLVEGNNPKALDTVMKIAGTVSPFVFEMDSVSRKSVHLAAVIANNFSNHLFMLAEKILAEKNIPFPLLGPLLHETVIKAIKLTPGESQTGPAKRGDSKIIETHVAMLKRNPALQKIYRLLSESIEKESGMML